MERECKRVLIVDDEYFITRSIAFMLRKEGFDCMTASNGEEALALISGHNFQLLVLDISMPKIDGFEVLDRIKGKPCQKNLHIILLSAAARDDELERGFELGANDFVSKPFDPKGLVAMVKQVL